MATPVIRKLLSFCSLILLLVSLFSMQLLGQHPACAAISRISSKVVSNPAFKFVKQDSGLQEYRLNSNGLTVLLQERHNAPVVTVMVVYKVGSRNEAVGYTGSTHFLEHMMFRGTPLHDPQKGTSLDDLLKPIGGENNATTWFDRTNYYEIVPAKDIAVCLDVEADRMRHALLRESDRKAEMTVVRNELERDENTASEILTNQVFATAFREHPYHHPTIGWRSDVEGVPTERLRQFYNDFYYPNNAVLVVIGDFQTAPTLDLINKYFSKVPASKKPFPKVYTTEPPQEGERRFIVQKGEENPKLMLGFHIPNAVDKDAYPLEVLASILGDQKRQSTRLYKKLVDSGLASQAEAINHSMKDPGLFTVFASVTTGTKLETLEKAIEDELANLGKNEVSPEELDRAKKAIWKKLRLESDDPMTFAELIADAEAVADWTWLFSLEKNINKVTAADVMRVAKKYFTASNRTVGYYLPKEPHGESKSSSSDSVVQFVEPAALEIDGQQQKSDSMPSVQAMRSSDKSARLVASGSVNSNAKTLVSPAKGKGTVASKTLEKTMPNGMTVYVMPVRGSGIVAMAGKLKGGESCVPADKSTVAVLASEMLNKGSRNYSKDQLAENLETMGASFDPHAENFWTEFEAEVVNEDLEKFTDMVSDALRQPLFQSEELEKLKKQKEADIKDEMVETSSLAMNKLLGTLYKPGCVYYHPPFKEQIEEVTRLSVGDLKEFHKKNYVAGNMVLAFVGDLSADQGFKLAEKYFGDWERGTPSDMTVSACKCDESVKGKQIVSNLADKSSVDIYMGYPADVSITSKDFCAAQLANAALGHDTISSRLAEVRNKYGLTYGISSMFTENVRSMAPWLIELTVNPENTAKSMGIVKGIVANYVKKGITPAELRVEKTRLAGEFVVNRMRTSKQLAVAVTKYGALGLGAGFMDRYPGMLSQVTLKEANSAIAKYMKLDDLVTSLAGSVPASIKSK